MKILDLFKRRPHFESLEVVNDSDKVMAVACEPWGHDHDLPPGAKVTIRYEVDRTKQAIETISISGRYIQIWFAPMPTRCSSPRKNRDARACSRRRQVHV